jgi:pyridoxamine 5'-phosphate oxidase-like protein
MGEPTPTAPRIDPAYGVVPDASGAELLPWSWAVARLLESRNYWIATTRPDGRPHSTPVWGVWLDAAVWFCIGRTSVKARNIARNPAIAVHLESGDQVVILEGRAAEQREGLVPFLDAYESKYELRPDLVALDATVFVLQPETALTWDEADYPRTAVRWVFGRG